MDVSQEASFDHIYLKHLLSFLTEIKSRYFHKGFNPEEINNRILRNLLNISYNGNPAFSSSNSLNWNSLTTTSDFYHVKNLTNFDSKNSEIALLIVQELKRLKKVMNQENDELNYKEIADFFLYRLEKNSFFDLYSSSNGSNSPLSGENNNSDIESNLNYKLNPLILYEENYNEMHHNFNNFVQNRGKIQSTGFNKRKKPPKCAVKLNALHEKIEKKKKYDTNKEKEVKEVKNQNENSIQNLVYS